MAEGFEPYHVPQQSRRDKLRVLAQDAVAFHGGCAGFFPIYDPSLLGNPDFPAYGGGGHDSLLYNHHHHHQQHQQHQQQELPLGGACKGSAVKEEGPNQMAGVNAPNIPPPASSHHPNYSDLLSSIPANPLPIQDMAANPFLYVPHSLRDYDHQSFNGSGSLLSLTPHDANIASTGQGLSLSLSSSSSHNATHPNLPPEIFNGAASNGMTARGSVSVSVVPLGPFTGYASILNGSRFLRPARQLLEEFCDVGREGLDAQRSAAAPDSPAESLGDMSGIDGDDGLGCGGELERKKPRLVSMLEEVYKKYKQYHQQLQLVVASFESVAGLGNAAPYANLALKAMSRHFRCLKNAITSQLQFPKKPLGHMNSHGKADGPGFGNPDGGLYGQRSVQNLGFFEHQPVWRTQRGLPERAVTVLRGWLFEHFLHPYPSDSDKLMLAKQTGLTRSQVSNWFINARVRLWKPMVEEIHMLETRQAKPAPQREEQQPQPHPPHGDASNDQSLPPPSPHALETRPATSSHRIMDAHYNVARNDLPEVMPVEPVSFSYNGLPDEAHHLGGGMGMACGGGGGGGGVSLTLGLHNGIGLSEPFPINVAQRFGLGLDPNGGGYVIGDGFEGQTRHFGGQLMHDFVG